VNDPDHRVTFSIRENDGASADTWTDNELGADEEHLTADRAVTFTNLAFIGAALRRSAWLWCATALFGVLIGYGLYTRYPPPYQATTSILLTNDPGQDPSVQIQANTALAQSQAVAGRAARQLGLQQSGSSLIAYTVTSTSDQVLVFTVSASSSNDAVRRASGLTTAFLQFRASYLKNQEQIEETALIQGVNQATQQVASINRQVSQVSAQQTSPAQQAKLSSLRAQLTAANVSLGQAQQKVPAEIALARTTLTTMTKGSEVLSAPTPIPHSLKKGKAFYIAVTFLIGLVIGIAIVIVRALVSDRLRNRDDIAEAIGAPIKLSLGPLAGRTKLPGLGRRAGRQVLDMTRLIRHLNGLVTHLNGRVRPLSGAVPQDSRRPQGLAIVAVDNAEVVAPAVVSLAASNASYGKQVVVADLSDGGRVARRLGVRKPGIHAVRGDGADFVVIVPERDEIALLGPIPGSQAEPMDVSSDLAAACDSADLLLTFATLDPAVGGDYLSTWATDAAAVVTVGKSSSVRIRAVGEMIRLAGTRLVSVVLIGTDKSDETLGSVYARDDQSASALPF
jgi:capsular polysaccharide biosynthesis protein